MTEHAINNFIVLKLKAVVINGNSKNTEEVNRPTCKLTNRSNKN